MTVELAGRLVDSQGRCEHYRTEVDVVAIRFACCSQLAAGARPGSAGADSVPYYGCHRCHSECADHPAVVWPATDRQVHAVACGVCRRTLSIDEYIVADQCPHCGAAFNPRCRLHHHLYFG